jgi:hypothetical protein
MWCVEQCPRGPHYCFEISCFYRNLAPLAFGNDFYLSTDAELEAQIAAELAAEEAAAAGKA